ncbi:hypothetical protein CYR32_17120 [Chimaeribacter coloradensis]|uniref:Uncharacterized protein n=1 Tax=Chimaeribacter coloradensis TaxID=2060068 RepID=A0A2N5DW44_9GAMM|nr:hypothetical protein CYR32_17120 [Chimaeribacter coloradensis]
MNASWNLVTGQATERQHNAICLLFRFNTGGVKPAACDRMILLPSLLTIPIITPLDTKNLDLTLPKAFTAPMAE